jgi:predicted DNA-binding transcriptional regulator AlpA
VQRTPELLTTGEVAQLLEISPQRVRQLVRDRADFPPAIETPGHARSIAMRHWRRDDIERWQANADRSPGRRWPR